MKRRDKSELSVDAPLRIDSKNFEGVVNRMKEHVKHPRFVAENKRIQFMCDGECQVAVTNRQQFGPTIIQPFLFDHVSALGAVAISTRIVGIVLVSTATASV